MTTVSSEETIQDVIRRVLPAGTAGDSSGWESVCFWPPDLFAAVATITERSGLYSERTFMAYWNPGFELKEQWIEDVRDAGRKWATLAKPPRIVRSLWRELLRRHRNARIVDRSPAALEWKKIVFRLLAITDEACAGIGFRSSGSASVIPIIFYQGHRRWILKRLKDREAIGGGVLPYLPHSLCIAVPPQIVCVQPKTSTPIVGCTLRSLTHHLALLPSVGHVRTFWHIADRDDEQLKPFNILVVPFPYSLPGKSFKSGDGHFPGASNDRTFTLDPDVWVKGISPAMFGKFLRELIEAAKPELDAVHAIVLPETALREEFARKVAAILARDTGLDLFLTGIVRRDDGETRNAAGMFRFLGGEVIQDWQQSKHHRWCLTGDQIRRYHLGQILDPNDKWWEQIDVSQRSCHVNLFRPEATLSVLICEDLARHDPVLTVMNAIGPNLVVALLMDGPQLERRWPGRYATALADDPGSAVLTVTSLGMVARSAMPGEPMRREIALWKEPNGRAQELQLPKGDHALLLTLTGMMVEQVTLDGRGDGEETVSFSLGAASGIAHPAPPKWLGRVP